ncbi:hypothetical protein DITRI_Ditri17bG0097100 [Diplodiscus trichospermus]
MQLLHECNYVMAAICFERAHDSNGEKLARAFGLRADADRSHGLNPEMACTARRQAAEIFYSIGKAEHAADCFFMLKEYKKAGQIYLEKCGESALERAAECFLLARCYKIAAEVYARGNYFSKCLSVCTKGKLFDMGLQYIQYWKQHANADEEMVEKSTDMEELKQKFLESCAHHYHEANDKRTMMNYVRAFDSVSSKRTFLRSLECLDELMLLEEESGNFLEAANIAKLKGELLVGADLLGKGAHFEEASGLILWFVFAKSLWLAGSTGWPLKQFTEKEKRLTKAKLFAKKVSNQFYGLVCSEADILLNKPSNLFVMKQYLSVSQRHSSIRGEILTARMILDHHFHLNISKYEWIDEFIFDLASYSEDQISNNRVSTESLVYFWNFWKDKIIKIFEYLDHAENQDTSDSRRYGGFCLDYFGVWRQFNNLKPVYLLLNSDAEWLRKLDDKHLCVKKKQVSISLHQFVSAARSYWCSELLSVGLQVLKILEFLNNERVEKDLTKSVQLSTEQFFGYIFPLDWRESLRENMVYLRGTEISRNLLEKVILDKTCSKKKSLSYGEIGKLILIILGSSKLNTELYGKILEGLEWNEAWKNFIASLKDDIGSATGSSFEPIVLKFHEALRDTYHANWRRIPDYISPVCFLYLIERYLFLLSCVKGYFFTTKSTFVEWLIYQDGISSSTSSLMAVEQQSLGEILKFVIDMVKQFLYFKGETIEWIKKSHIYAKEYHPLMVLRLVIIVCLIHLNFGSDRDLLLDLLGQKHIIERLPWEFYDVLQRRRGNIDLNVLAQAFGKIRNPLVIVSVAGSCPKFGCPDSIFVDMKVNPHKEEIMRVLFPKTGTSQHHTADFCSGELPQASYDEGESSNLNTQNDMVIDHVQFWEIVEAFKELGDIKDQGTFMSYASKMREYLGKYIFLLNAATEGCLQKERAGDEDNFSREAISLLEEMKHLRNQLEPSELKLENSISIIGALCEELQSRRSTVEPFLQQLFLQKDENHISDESGGHCDAEESTSKAEECTEGKKPATEATVNCKPQGNSKSKKKNKKSGRKRNKHS